VKATLVWLIFIKHVLKDFKLMIVKGAILREGAEKKVLALLQRPVPRFVQIGLAVQLVVNM
jgi:hypothetical protein